MWVEEYPFVTEMGTRNWPQVSYEREGAECPVDQLAREDSWLPVGAAGDGAQRGTMIVWAVPAVVCILLSCWRPLVQVKGRGL